jgi:hypothetical protein
MSLLNTLQIQKSSFGKAIVAAALFSVLLPGSALAITAEQAAGQARFVQEIDSRKGQIETITTSVDNYEKLYSAKLNPGADTAAMAQALVDLLRIKLEVQDNWIYGKGVRQNSELAPLITAWDEVSKALIFGGTLLPTAGISPEGQSAARNANMKLRQAMTAYLEVGKDAPRSQANQAALDTTYSRVQAALGYFNQLSEADRKRTPGGLAMLQNILNIMRFIEDTDARWKKTQNDSEQQRKTCETYRDQHKSQFTHMIRIGIKGDIVNRSSTSEVAITQWLSEIATDLNAADTLTAQCKNPEQMKVFAACYPEVNGEESLTHFYNDNDPEAWCMVAPKMRSLLAEEALVTAQWSANMSAIGSAAENKANSEGWVSSDSLLTFDEMFSVSPEKRQIIIEPVKTVFDALEMNESSFNSAFATMEESLKKQGNEALARAPGIQQMKGPGTFYGVDLAKSQVKRVLPNAQIMTASSHTQWSVTKNALDVPLYRDRNGWVVFNVPGEEFCQERSFHASEKWNGSGYNRDQGVTFVNVRWVPCNP